MVASLFRYFLVVLVFTFSGQLHAFVSPEKLEKYKWWKASTDNFVIITNSSQKKAKTLAVELEKFRSVVGLITNAKLSSDDPPLTVFAVKGNKPYDAVMGSISDYKEFGGMFFQGLEGNYSVVRMKHSSNPVETLYHEYVHYLTFLNPNVVIPYWYSEGVADYLSLVKFGKKNTVDIGLPDHHHLYRLNQMKWRPIEDIIKKKVVVDKKSDEFYQMYSQSWLLVHYLLSDEERKSNLKKYLMLRKEGKSIDSAFDEAFGVSFDDLDLALKKYKKQPTLYYVKLTLGRPIHEGDIKVQRMELDNLHVYFGRFLSQRLGQVEAGNAHFNRAVELNPQSASGHAGLALLEYEKDLEVAKQHINTALLQSQNDPWVNFIAGKVKGYELFELEGSSGKYTPAKFNEMVAHYQKAMDSNEYIPTVFELAKVYYKINKRSAALDLLEAVTTHAPTNHYINQLLANVYVNLGRINDAYAVIDQMLRKNHLSDSYIESVNKWVPKLMKGVANRDYENLRGEFERVKIKVLRESEDFLKKAGMDVAEIEFQVMITAAGYVDSLEVIKSDITDPDYIERMKGILSKSDFGKREVKKTMVRYKYKIILED